MLSLVPVCNTLSLTLCMCCCCCMHRGFLLAAKRARAHAHTHTHTYMHVAHSRTPRPRFPDTRLGPALAAKAMRPATAIALPQSAHQHFGAQTLRMRKAQRTREKETSLLTLQEDRDLVVVGLQTEHSQCPANRSLGLLWRRRICVHSRVGQCRHPREVTTSRCTHTHTRACTRTICIHVVVHLLIYQ